MLENTARPSQPPPPAAHRHVQQTDLPAEQTHIQEAVPKRRLAGCILAVLLGGWMLVVPIALVDRLKDVPGPEVGTLTVIIVAFAVVTAALGGFRFFNALDERRGLSIALVISSAAAIAAALISASIPGYGKLLLIPALVFGVPALLMLSRDIARG
ncbi:hypothetical protein D7Z96_01115 [Pseudarthrobacter phenanthrenivorans]|uniref:Uncharacterized protein n=1 Tax=Pseudarthrobacter phenanthrenivorans TaxID=361575 RepID=A0A3B0FLR4_PSEPS|nr:hypothetical protein D7Z96_01115 [Pseudarthrobacter phenanthrenivorans]